MTGRQRFDRALAFYIGLVGWRSLGLLLLTAFTLSLLEAAGIAMVLPYLEFVVHGAQTESASLSWELGATLRRALSPFDHKQMVVSIGLGLLMLFAGKGWVHTQLIRYQLNRVADINYLAADRFVDKALNARYGYFLEMGAVRVGGISYSNAVHASLLLQSIILALNELMWLAFVLIGLTVMFPLLSGALLVVVTVFAVLVVRPWSQKVAGIGARTQQLDHARHRFVFAMVSAIRDIKIMALEPLFIRRNRRVVKQHVDLGAEYAFISSAIRIGIELALGASLVVFCMWFGLSGQSLEDVAPVLAVGALVMARAAPSLSRVMAAYNGFRYSLPFVEVLLDAREDLNRYGQANTEPSCGLPGRLAVHDLSFRYGDKQVLTRVSFDVPRGAVVAIIGPSGSGKSTLLDCVSGLLPPDEGLFTIEGVEFVPFLSRSFRERIGYVPQTIALLDASLKVNIALEDSPDEARLQRAISRANLDRFVADLPEGLDTMLGEGGVGISGGQRQRVGIARALYREPALLILDEVTSALDATTEAAVMSELLELRRHTSLLLVTHRLPSVAHVDTVYRLEDGHLTKVPEVASRG